MLDPAPTPDGTPSHSPRRLLDRPAAWILVLALAVRLAAVGLAVGWDQPPSDKSGRYDPIARNLVAGDGFALSGKPTAASPPLYPLLLAAAYGVAGESPTAARLVLALLDTLHCAVWMSLAWTLLGRRVALLTGVLLALCPYFAYMVVTAGSDGPYILLHGVFLALLVRAWRRRRARDFAVAGIAVGCATLCRVTSLFEPLFLAPVIVMGLAEDRRRAVRGAAVLLLFYALTLTPWTVRNWIWFGRLIPIQTLGGYTLIVSNFEPRDPRLLRELERAREGRATAAGRDAGMFKRGLDLVLKNPGDYALKCGRRLYQMWYITHSRRFAVPLGLANALLLTAAGVGLYRARHRLRDLLPVLATGAYFIAFHSLLAVVFRYMLPVVPILLMLAAAAVRRPEA